MPVVTMAGSVVQREMAGIGVNRNGCCGRPLGSPDLMGLQKRGGKACIMSAWMG